MRVNKRLTYICKLSKNCLKKFLNNLIIKIHIISTFKLILLDCSSIGMEGEGLYIERINKFGR